jgi:hypothetical protein
LLFGLAALAAGLVALVLSSLTALFWTGEPGWNLEPAGSPFVVDVGSLVRNGPAARAGVLVGDRIDLRKLAFADRVLLVTVPVAGRPLHVVVERQRRVIPVDVVPGRVPLRWDVGLGYLILLWIAAFAATIAWRRPGLPETRLLSAALSCYVAADALQFLTTPSAALNLLFSALNTGGVLGGITLLLLVRFTARFGRPLGVVRRIVDGFAYAAAAVLALFGIASAAALGTVAADPIDVYYGLWGVGIVCGAQVAVVVSGAFAIAGSRGAERQRVTWAVASIGTLLAAGAVEIALNAMVPTRDMQLATQAAVNVVAIVAPVGLTYSVLSRRLLDVGFALNRAAVFSALSVLLIGTFMTIEWAVGGWLVKAGNVTSTAVGVAVALGLGFSIRFAHGRVERAVDRVFFRKRYLQEKALLRFASEVPFINDSETLLRRAVREVAALVEIGTVVIVTDDGSGSFVFAAGVGLPGGPVDADDPALVALRARREPVDLHSLASALSGEYAFPMTSRGLLVGALVCGAKTSGDAYAPDERETLAKVAHAVGAAYDALGGDRGSLGAAILGLQDQFAALRSEVQSLVDAVRAERRPVGDEGSQR